MEMDVLFGNQSFGDGFVDIMDQDITVMMATPAKDMFGKSNGQWQRQRS